MCENAQTICIDGVCMHVVCLRIFLSLETLKKIL